MSSCENCGTKSDALVQQGNEWWCVGCASTPPKNVHDLDSDLNKKQTPLEVGKSAGILDDMAEVRKQGLCPLCGKEPGEFSDEKSRREFEISGMCQTCQDDFFGREGRVRRTAHEATDDVVRPVICGQCGGQGGYPAATFDPSDPGWHACYHCNTTGYCTSDCLRCGSGDEKTAHMTDEVHVHDPDDDAVVIGLGDQPKSEPKPKPKRDYDYQMPDPNDWNDYPDTPHGWQQWAHLGAEGWKSSPQTLRAMENADDIIVEHDGTAWAVRAVYSDGHATLRRCVSEYAAHLALAELDEKQQRTTKKGAKEIPNWIRDAAINLEKQATSCSDCGSIDDVQTWTPNANLCGTCRAAYEV